LFSLRDQFVGAGVEDASDVDFGLAELLLLGAGLADDEAEGEPDALADGEGVAVFSGFTVVADGT
jgi:hypothetical protein